MGDQLEIIHPSGNQIIDLTSMRGKEGEPVKVAAGNGVKVSIPLDARFEKALIARLM